MASTGRRTRIDLTEALFKRPGSFGFFQAVRMLSLIEGKGGIPRKLRFRTPGSLAFPHTEILRLEEPSKREQGERDALEMEVGFMGLTGPLGVLPAPYTELVEDRRLHFQDGSLHAFLDLFSHRATTLFAQAWFKYRPHLGLEQGKTDGFSQHTLDLSGMALKAGSAQDTQRGFNGTVIHFAGLLGRRPLPSLSIRAVVEGFLGIPVRLDQFVLHWMEVDRSERTRLGGRQPEKLGEGAMLGARQRDGQTGIRLVLGPLNLKQFTDLLPGAKGARELEELMHRLVGPTVSCEVCLILRKEEVPPPILGRQNGLRLGRNIWTFRHSPESDRNEAVYRLGTPGAA